MAKDGTFKALVIGNKGQIGSALQTILRCDGMDKEDILPKDKYDIIHICIPYSDWFDKVVKRYQMIFAPKYTVIHSTVPVGTSRRLGAAHSPVRGLHPDLVSGIRTFTKYLGCDNATAKVLTPYFESFGLSIMPYPKPDVTEALKLWDTTVYGWNIVLEKMIHKWCEENDLSFGMIYTHANETYNVGYQKLGYPEYKKYILKHDEGKIGGHCVMQNLELLDSPIGDIIKDINGTL